MLNCMSIYSVYLLIDSRKSNKDPIQFAFDNNDLLSARVCHVGGLLAQLLNLNANRSTSTFIFPA